MTDTPKPNPEASPAQDRYPTPTKEPKIEAHVAFLFDEHGNFREVAVRVGDFGVAPLLPVDALNEAMRRLRLRLDKYMIAKQAPFRGPRPGGDAA